MTQWPDELQLELQAMAQGGDAVGRYKGRAVFAAGGLPREQVRIRLHDRQAAFARGRVIEVLAAAPERVASFCPLEQTCGAADWRWIDYEAQRRFKAEILHGQLQHIGGIEVDVMLPPPPAILTGYRTTAELHAFGDTIGYYRPGSRRVADIPACCLHHPLVNAALDALRPLLSPDIKLRGVTIRCSPETGQVLGALDGRGPLPTLAERWRKRYTPLVGVTNARGVALDGQNWLSRHVNNIHFHVSANSFFQINFVQLEPLVERVQTLLDLQPQHRLLDLYCGVGLFALSFAQNIRAAVGVEEWAPAVEDARRSAERNNIHNAEFRAGAAEQVINELDQHFDRVVLDPPRRGCAPEVLAALATLMPERIVYVSCHPGTLARDCKQLAANGYAVTHAEVIDMFPQSSHVESIVQLDRMYGSP